ncbi:hypothetical protein ATN84_25240 [Paramesorhizobium deserti]|uniref:Uncharacterized protein n=1 Tax=Paramesorhizobium deserti TaxID=1494590 RepID=A0A135HXD1_9HYPH|nr:hypothetical protein [Paramesorhizobium deserti]KXF77849.1 hypothetical protein ATN84_25240 [Paramesorhizobium deserti]
MTTIIVMPSSTSAFIEIDIEDGLALIEAIELRENDGFEWKARKGLLCYYAEKSDGKVALLAQVRRRLDKRRSGDRSGLSILGIADLRDLVRQPDRHAPAIILLKQEGGSALGWKAGPFWWPMLVSPRGANSCVFATRIAAQAIEQIARRALIRWCDFTSFQPILPDRRFEFMW